MIISGFEVGDDTGDAPGEFQHWVEREKMTGTLAVPGAPHPLRFNTAGLYGSVGCNTRDGTITNGVYAELITALCLHPGLDLRKTYWIINGISGIDPLHGPAGSAVWSANVVDGDAARELAENEMPLGWPHGIWAIGADRPGVKPPPRADAGGWAGATLSYSMNYPLNLGLARWAHALSRERALLTDTEELRRWRARYAEYPHALDKPQVLMGATLGTSRYWHGERRTRWAREWVRMWTDDAEQYSTCGMEQAAYVGTLRRMSAQGLADYDRVMMVRGASNYSQPPRGESVLTTMGVEAYGTPVALEAAYRAGSVVAHELLSNWARYEYETPALPTPVTSSSSGRQP